MSNGGSNIFLRLRVSSEKKQKGILHFEIKIDLKSMSYIKNVTLQLKTHRIDSLSFMIAHTK